MYFTDFTEVAHTFGFTAKELREHLRGMYGRRGYRVIESPYGEGLVIEVRDTGWNWFSVGTLANFAYDLREQLDRADGIW